MWNGNVGGGYGHIDIVIENISENGFTGFDQNWNTPLKCNIESHSYSNVYGFLRPRTSPGPIPPTRLGDSNKWKRIYSNRYIM